MISAFGVEHGDEVSKAGDKYDGHKAPTKGRRLAASAGGGLHPLIAGKSGHKARAFGNTAVRAVGGSMAGGVAGSLTGAALSRGNPVASAVGSGVGSLAGLHAGTQRAVTINTRRGHFKKQPKGQF